MSDFRIKLFALASLATLFTGISYGQVTCTGVGAGQTLVPTQPILVRAESEADLVSDVLITCPNSTATSNGQLTVFASLPVTSKSVTGLASTAGFIGGGNSEAILTVVDTAAVVTTYYQGTVAGSVITFNGVNFPAKFTAQISNVRVNASSAAVGSTPVAITESIFAGTNGLATYVNNGITVGYALKSLVAPTLTLNAFNQPIINSYAVCTGNPASAPTLSFTVVAAETFGGFFKTQTGVSSAVGNPVVVQNGEQGSLVNPGGVSAAIGSAASGTNFTFTLGNIPASATVYMPGTVQATPTTPPGTAATLTIVAAVGQTPVTSPAAVAGLYAFTPTSGTVTITYQVTASNNSQVESFSVPFDVTFAANSAAVQGPMTVLEAYSPATALTGQATTIPTFAPTTNTPLNASTIFLCQTSLLFPFVTNQLGFDTGIVFANTSTDNLGAGGKSLVTPQAGTCTLSFYGAGAPATATGVADPGGSTASGSTHAFLLSSVAPGFQGYVIATCPFLYAHGYGFLEYNLTQTNGAVEGYIAEVLSVARAAGVNGPEAITF